MGILHQQTSEICPLIPYAPILRDTPLPPFHKVSMSVINDQSTSVDVSGIYREREVLREEMFIAFYRRCLLSDPLFWLTGYRVFIGEWDMPLTRRSSLRRNVHFGIRSSIERNAVPSARAVSICCRSIGTPSIRPVVAFHSIRVPVCFQSARRHFLPISSRRVIKKNKTPRIKSWIGCRPQSRRTAH